MLIARLHSISAWFPSRDLDGPRPIFPRFVRRLPQESSAASRCQRQNTVAQAEAAYGANVATYRESVGVDLRVRQMTASVNLVKALGGGWNASELPAAGSLVSGR
jgi:hypothetical protein